MVNRKFTFSFHWTVFVWTCVLVDKSEQGPSCSRRPPACAAPRLPPPSCPPPSRWHHRPHCQCLSAPTSHMSWKETWSPSITRNSTGSYKIFQLKNIRIITFNESVSAKVLDLKFWWLSIFVNQECHESYTILSKYAVSSERRVDWQTGSHTETVSAIWGKLPLPLVAMDNISPSW